MLCVNDFPQRYKKYKSIVTWGEAVFGISSAGFKKDNKMWKRDLCHGGSGGGKPAGQHANTGVQLEVPKCRPSQSPKSGPVVFSWSFTRRPHTKQCFHPSSDGCSDSN